jgi:iron complex outermembrane receptor protein
MNKYLSALLVGCSGLALTIGVSQSAHAQTVAPGPVASEATDRIEAVIVTARRRAENLLSVPGSVSALTAKDVELRGIVTLDDVANFTPGVTDDQANAGGARSDRSFQQIIIRGMNPSSTLNPTTSIFINGTPVASADFLQNLDDIDRVEVLKGPQSAYFGRETFAGAINVITRPAGNDLSGFFSAEVGTRNTLNVAGSVSAPIIADKLSVLVGGSYDAHDGSYKNAFNPSQTLGDQSTQSFHIGITAHPIDNLTIKVYSQVFRDEDGPAATGILIASGAGAFNQGNCTVSGSPFFCGTLPGLIRSVSPAQSTTLSTVVSNFLSNPGGIIPANQTVQRFGLRRDGFHADVNVEYVVPNIGVTATYLASYNHDQWSELSDLSNVDGAPTGQYPGYNGVGVPGILGFPFVVENVARDSSQEFRLTTDSTKRYRALLGFSYIDSWNNSALGLVPFGVDGGGETQSETYGGYFSLAYDIFSSLTVNFDGRYQVDQETAYDATGAKTVEGKTHDFLPRASIQYRFMPHAMVYFTYSRGVNPGAFNTQYSTIPTVSQEALQTLGVAGGLIVKPEKITNYEAGIKGSFFDGRATLSADVYYDQWRDQLNLNTYNFAAADPANPYNVVGGPQYVPNNQSIYPYTYTDNSASTNPKGVEVEVNVIPVNHVTLNLSGAYNDTRYNEFNCTSCNPYPTSGFNAAGKYLPNAPRFSFTGGAQYANVMNLFGGTESWYIRGDYIYKDGIYIQSSNTVKTPDINLVNLRAGISFNRFTVEGFVNNVFNNRSYTSGFQDVNFGNFSFAPTTVMVGLPQLITGGVKLKYKF